MIKKVLAIFVGMSIALGSLTACSFKASEQKSTTNTDPTKETVSASNEKVTLKFVHCEGQDNPDLAALIKNFQEKNPNITINATYMVNSELKKQMRIAMLSNSLPDITVFDNPDFSAFASGGFLVNITDRMNKWGEVDQFYPGPLNSVKYKGDIYGIPWFSNNIALAYNQEMLDKAGVQPPKTWDELRAAAAKLTGNGVYGLAIGAIKSEVGTFQYIPWLYSAGGTYDKLDSPESIKALTFLTNLVKDGYMSKEVANYDNWTCQKAFEGGKAAMAVLGSWTVESLKTDVPNMKYGFVPIPMDKSSVSCLGGYDVGITKDCKHIDQAFEFLKYIGGKDGEDAYAFATKALPSRKDVLESNSGWADYPISLFVEQMPNAVARVNPFWPDLSVNIQVAVQESLLGAKTPEQALKDAQAKNSDFWK